MDKKMQPVIARRDDNGHWYVIPCDQVTEFNRLLVKSCEDGDEYSEAAEAEKKFLEKFSKYRTGGDLNNVQLYAEI